MSHSQAVETCLYRLYFGRNLPDNSEITKKQFNLFKDSTLTSAFPEGFTVYQTKGQWKGQNGNIVKESSFIFEILQPESEQTENKLDNIREEYKTKFHQDAVLYTKTKVQFCF